MIEKSVSFNDGYFPRCGKGEDQVNPEEERV
jgi:hypothetical protein